MRHTSSSAATPKSFSSSRGGLLPFNDEKIHRIFLPLTATVYRPPHYIWYNMDVFNLTHMLLNATVITPCDQNQKDTLMGTRLQLHVIGPPISGCSGIGRSAPRFSQCQRLSKTRKSVAKNQSRILHPRRCSPGLGGGRLSPTASSLQK